MGRFRTSSRSPYWEGARRASRAQWEFEHGHDGFYVCNDETDRPVAGPFETHGEAAREAFSIQPPAMRVVRLEEGRVAPLA